MNSNSELRGFHFVWIWDSTGPQNREFHPTTLRKLDAFSISKVYYMYHDQSKHSGCHFTPLIIIDHRWSLAFLFRQAWYDLNAQKIPDVKPELATQNNWGTWMVTIFFPMPLHESFCSSWRASKQKSKLYNIRTDTLPGVKFESAGLILVVKGFCRCLKKSTSGRFSSIFSWSQSIVLRQVQDWQSGVWRLKEFGKGIGWMLQDVNLDIQ